MTGIRAGLALCGLAFALALFTAWMAMQREVYFVPPFGGG